MEILLTKDESDIQIIYDDEKKYLILDFLYHPSIVYQLRQIPGAIYGDIIPYKWVIPHYQLKELQRLLGKKIIWKTRKELERHVQELKTADEETLEDVLARIPKDIQTPFMTKEPYNFQKVAVAWAITPKGKRANIYCGLLADSMGLGKTIEAIAISGKLKELGKVRKCLIITPATLKLQWNQEIERFTKEKAVVISGDKKNRQKLYQKIKEENPFYTIINYELLIQREVIEFEKQVKKGKKQKTEKVRVKGDYTDLKHILDLDYDMVIIDEAHRIKNPYTQTSIAIRYILPPYRLLMTGTPIEKDLHNIFSLMDYLSPNILSDENLDFESRKKSFEERFCLTDWNPFTKWKKEKRIVGTRNKDVLRKLVAPYMLRRTINDVSNELPQMIGHDTAIVLDWDKDQKRLFEFLREKLMELHSKILPQDHLSKEVMERIENKKNELSLYMAEVCDHPNLLLLGSPYARNLAKNFLGKRKQFNHPPKFQWAMEKIEEIMRDTDDKIIVFSKFERMIKIFEHELIHLSKKMEKENHSKKPFAFGVVTYTGEMEKDCKWETQMKRENTDSKPLNCLNCPLFKECKSRVKSAWLFQNHPQTRIILMTDAGNYGVNLQSGKHLINYTLPDSFSRYEQRNGRIQRLGSSHSQVYIYNPVIKGGLDEKKFYELLRQKEEAEYIVEKNADEKKAVSQTTKLMN